MLFFKKPYIARALTIILINERVSMWKELVQPLLASFIINLSYFTLFLKLQTNRNKKKKLKSEKPKEGREATLLSQLGFDPMTCSERKNKKIEEQKNKGGQGSNSSVRARFRSWEL